MISQIRKIKHNKFSFLIASVGFAVILYGVIMHMRMPFNTGIILVYLCGVAITPQLAERLDASICYYNENPEVIIVVSGGQGYGETISEAAAMKQYLISKGIPEKAVLTEDRSTSTYTNLNNSKQILDNYFETEYTVVIVTNRYHTFRAAKIAQKAGMNFSVLCADTPPAEIPLRYLRECASICKYCFITMLEFFKVHK